MELIIGWYQGRKLPVNDRKQWVAASRFSGFQTFDGLLYLHIRRRYALGIVSTWRPHDETDGISGP